MQHRLRWAKEPKAPAASNRTQGVPCVDHGGTVRCRCSRRGKRREPGDQPHFGAATLWRAWEASPTANVQVGGLAEGVPTSPMQGTLRAFQVFPARHVLARNMELSEAKACGGRAAADYPKTAGWCWMADLGLMLQRLARRRLPLCLDSNSGAGTLLVLMMPLHMSLCLDSNSGRAHSELFFVSALCSLCLDLQFRAGTLSAAKQVSQC